MQKILVADDHPIICHGIKQIISEIPGMAVVAEAHNGNEVLEIVRKQEIDIVLLDLSMPGISAMDVLKQIKKEKPEIAVLIVSRYPEEQYAISTLKAGASGYLQKTSLVKELVTGLQQISTGKKYLSPNMTESLISQVKGNTQELPHDRLSDREMEVLCLIASGKSVSEIVDELCISRTTISTYRSRILKKMGLKNNSELIRYAMENELLF